MIFFKNVETIEDLKKEYRRLMMLHHQDRNPDDPTATETAKQINLQYKDLFEKLKNTHKNAKNETYESTNKTTETPDVFIDIIDKIINLNLQIDIIGSWIWVSGETKPHKEILKNLNFKFAPKKLAWYFHFEDFKKKTNKGFTMNELKDIFGCTTVHPAKILKLQ